MINCKQKLFGIGKYLSKRSATRKQGENEEEYEKASIVTDENGIVLRDLAELCIPRFPGSGIQ